MKQLIIIILATVVLLSGCSDSSLSTTNTVNTVEPGKVAEDRTDLEQEKKENEVVLPIADYAERLTYKGFGEFIQDRFKGYHVGDDIEYGDVTQEVPVSAIAEGVIKKAEEISGYGGVIIVEHTIGEKVIQALYGHLNLLTGNLKVGDSVSKGQFLANLGRDKSAETDGERKHLHFSLHEGGDQRLQGYEGAPGKVNDWINPYDFFSENGISMTKKLRTFDPAKDLGGEIYDLNFIIPEGWEVEYIPSLKSLNLYTLTGNGAVRERSQIFIRYFDAADFLTLQTVTIHSKTDLTLGSEDYTARRYDIEKKAGVANFPDQPAWRNERHLITDFRGKDGFTRYYVVAANPSLDLKLYEQILESITIVNLNN